MHRLIALSLLAALVLIPASLSAASRPSVHERRFIQATEERRDPLALANTLIEEHRRARHDPELLTDDAVLEIAGMKPVHGRQPVVDDLDAFFGAIGGRQITVETTVVAGDQVSVILRVQGHQTGKLLGVPATGRRIDIEMMGFIDARSGQIAHIRVMFDTLGLLRQIGALPDPAAVATA